MIGRVLFLMAFPVILLQALWVVIRAQKLPEASGSRTGSAGHGPPLRILIVGDSSAAGVGVDHLTDALPGQLEVRLAEHHLVSWKLVAKSGATAGSLLRMLDDVVDEPFDAAVIALGVNDSKNGVSERNWRRHYTALLNMLETRFGVTKTCVSGLPPLGEFPLLPAPLRLVLGRRALQFDKILREFADERGSVTYVSLTFPMDHNAMASDGFHPGPLVYDAWAAQVAMALAQETSGLHADQ